jgi:hypothetical protein
MNTKALKDEDVVMVLTADVEPSAKRAKIAPKPKGKARSSKA